MALRACWTRPLLTAPSLFSGLIGFVLVVGPFLLWDFILPIPLITHVATASASMLQYFREFFFTWMFVVFVGTVLLLEWRIPADKNQSPFSLGLFYDTGGTLLVLSYSFLILPFFLQGAFLALDHWVPFLRLVDLSALPSPIRELVAFCLIDLVRWLGHYLRHTIPFFWEFHAMHHSQRELSLFCEFRLHPGELIISHMLVLFLLYMCQVSPHTIVALQICEKWFLMLLHANVRTNFGLFGYVFVSPLSHRLHHSCLPEHANKNLGVSLSIWDRLFGTHQEPVSEDSLRCGVSGYPVEQDTPWTPFAVVYVRQFLYPLSRVVPGFFFRLLSSYSLRS